MLISEFAKAAELPIDTVRFYIAKGLLKPERSLKGGSNPYQIFKPDDVTAARMIRLQQTLGY
ncbi:MerR family transcriptional regulator [Rhizobium sp.]